MGHHGKKQHDNIDRRPAVVIDTCVLVRAMIGWNMASLPEGNIYRTAMYAVEHALVRYRVCFTPETLKEFCEVALDNRCKTELRPTQAMQRSGFVNYIKSRANMVEPKPSRLKSTDKKDQMILEAAQGCNARHIVSADNDILSLKNEAHCTFLHPVEFGQMMAVKAYTEAMRERAKGKPTVAFGQPNKGGYIKQYGPKSAKKAKPAEKAGTAKPH